MRIFRWLLSLGVSMVVVAGAASAQTYPVKPVRIITAAAGGGSDYATRQISTPLSAALGQQVIVDNRGVIAADLAAKATPDGYTLLLTGPTLWLLPFMRDNVASNISDLSSVTLATETANILVVHPQLAVKSVMDLIALAKARPGQLNYATSGTGNSVHIAAELFKSMSATNVVRVNYKAASQALTDLMSGQTQFMFSVPGSAMPHVKSGRLRALAVTSLKPTPLAPGMPTVAETIPGYESVSRLAFFAPAGTPAPIIARLNQEIVRILQSAEVKEKFFHSGIEAIGSTPAGLTALVDAEVSRMGKVIKDAGIRAD